MRCEPLDAGGFECWVPDSTAEVGRTERFAVLGCEYECVEVWFDIQVEVSVEAVVDEGGECDGSGFVILGCCSVEFPTYFAEAFGDCESLFEGVDAFLRSPASSAQRRPPYAAELIQDS
jgi:hypothetical protein